MKCFSKEYMEQYISGALRPDQSRKVEAHLQACRACSDLKNKVLTAYAEKYEVHLGYRDERDQT